ncbi:MAG: HPF/RaiA family ribosome-associated protein [Saprospiraceae bacterium]|nr:HPF/RaiA family ribosome-associated protein [Saprospiraceae bacterium]
MQIKIEAPGHTNQAQMQAFYEEKLLNKYKKYNFIHNVDVKVAKVSGSYEVSLQIKPEGGATLFAKDTNRSEDSALDGAIKRMNSQIERFKEKHYRSSHLNKRG